MKHFEDEAKIQAQAQEAKLKQYHEEAEIAARKIEARQLNLKKEAQVMRDVPNYQVGANPYNSGVWMPRHVQELRRDLK
jgi:hypothetical protein